MEQQNSEIKYIKFSSTQDEVKKTLLKTMKNNHLIYNKYKNINITPIYLPCNLYTYDVCGFIDLKCIKRSSWKSQNYKYVKSDEYKANREVTGKVFDVVVCCHKELDINDLLLSYDYKKLKKFDSSKPLKYNVLKGDKTKLKIKKEGIEKAKEKLKNEIIDGIIGYDYIEEDKSSLLFNNEVLNHVLLPVWIVELSGEDSIQKFYINGQNNSIFYKFKASGYRLFILWIVLFIITLVIMLLINILR